MDKAIQPQPAMDGKKEYTSPQLIEYGDLTKITQSGAFLIPGDTASTFAG
jgi:hypothetical protein